MKQVIQRHLPLDVNYSIIDKAYVPLLEGGGGCCDNCGRLIANIATVKSDNGKYSIGFDCLETILINNNQLSSGDIEAYEANNKSIPKILRISKQIKEVVANNPSITGIHFEDEGQWGVISFHWEILGSWSRANDYFKFKDIDYKFFITTLKAIFPKLNFQRKV